jgi:superfamily II DNA helicase RecQ
MQLKIFVIPVKNSEDAEAEMNRFLLGQKVLSIKKEFVAEGENSFWSFCVEYLTRTVPEEGVRGAKIDYREVLSPEQFKVYGSLRSYRKLASERDGVPIYAVFTNVQLAQMVTTPTRSLADLRKIDGIGEARIAKHGERLLAILLEGAGAVAV